MLWVCSKTIYSYMWSTPEPDVPSRERKTDESNDQTKYEALNNLNWIMLLLLDHYLTMINYFLNDYLWNILLRKLFPNQAEWRP